jgi:hypothetical protein
MVDELPRRVSEGLRLSTAAGKDFSVIGVAVGAETPTRQRKGRER